MVLKRQCIRIPLRACYSTDGWVHPQSFRFSGFGVGTRIINISNKFPGDAAAASPGTTLAELAKNLGYCPG